MIKEFERYHGVVLRDIVVCADAPTIFEPFDEHGRVNSFLVARRFGLHIKHSSKRLPPWQFTFHAEHIHEIQRLEEHSECAWIALVCGEDGVVLITSDELREMNECDDEATWFVRVTRDRHTMYHLNGSADELLAAKPRGVGGLIAQINGAK
jgi:hypothetical protein